MDATPYITFAHRWWWLLLTGTVLSIAAYGVAVQLRDDGDHTPVFSASETLFVSLTPRTDTPGAQPITVDQPWDMDRLLATYALMLKSDSVAQRAAADLGVANTSDDIRRRITTGTVGTTQLLRLRVTAASPIDASPLATGIVRAFQEVRAEQALPGNAVVTETSPASLEAQSHNNMLLNTLIVAVAGFFAAAGLIFVFEYVSDSVRDARDVEAASGVAVLAAIPRWRANRRGQRALGIDVERNSAALEAYRSLRTNAGLKTKHDDAQVIVIAGAASGDGATTTAANYAVSLAHSGRSVAIVDANLRTPALGGLFGVAGDVNGLGDALIRDLPIGHVVRPTAVNGLSIVTAGSQGAMVSDLLETPRFGALLDGLRARFDAIVIDAPPLLEATDATVIAAQADAAIAVVRCDRTTRADTASMVQTLRRADVRVLGIVLNGDNSGLRARRIALATYARQLREMPEDRAA